MDFQIQNGLGFAGDMLSDSLDDTARRWLIRHNLYDDAFLHADGEGYGPTKNSYSSPYYDYQKAHEYYEQHKQLKGRTRSKSQLSDEGKEVWEVTQANIKKAKEAEQTSMSEQLKTNIAGIQASISQLKELAAGERGAKKAEIQNRISVLKAQLAQKKEALRSELKKRQEDVKSDNARASEASKERNAAITEAGKRKKERNAQNAQSSIERKQAEIKNLGSSPEDTKKKERLRADIASIRSDKQKTNAGISASVATEKASNSAELKSYKAKNQQELAAYKAQNASEVKQASESINSSIKEMREDLKNFNTQNREKVKADTQTMRDAIKQYREINKENRRILKEKYKSISDSEFDKIYARYPKEKK